MSQLLSKLRSLGRIFLRYPVYPEVRPKQTFNQSSPDKSNSEGPRIAIQVVYDKFYFLLFRELDAELRSRILIKSDLLLVQSINGGVGLGLQAKFLRSLPISWLRSNQWVRGFGNNMDGIGYRSASWDSPISALKNWRKAKQLWLKMRSQHGKKSLIIDGIEIADLVIDTYLRLRPSPFFKVSDPFIVSIIRQALQDIKKSKAYFEAAKPEYYFTSYTTYIEHGVAARVALSLGINVNSFGSLSQFATRLTFSHPYHTPVYENYLSDFETLTDPQERLELARVQLESRLSGGIDPATVYMRKSAYSKEPDKLNEAISGSVIIFLHDFYDSPHIYPGMIFDDFWAWICFTVEVLTQHGIKFFIKPHPNQIERSDHAIDLLKRKYPGIKLLSSGTSNVSLVNAGISCGVTVYGTIAHELAFLGIPTICSAKHPHHAFEFCRTATSISEYKEMLLSFETLPVSKQTMKDQALAFYYMHNLNKSPQEIELISKYSDFWKACNIGDVQSAEVLEILSELTQTEGFQRYIDDLVNKINSGTAL